MTKVAIFALFLVCTMMLDVTTVDARPSNHPVMDLANPQRPPQGLSESAVKQTAVSCCPNLCRLGPPPPACAQECWNC